MKKTKKQIEKELAGLGAMEAIAIFFSTFAFFWLIKKMIHYQSNGIDLFLFFFILIFLWLLVPRFTGILPFNRFAKSHQYKKELEPQALLKDILIALAWGIVWGFVGFMSRNTR